MGFEFCMSGCFRCGRLVLYNPSLVPSIPHPNDGRLEPVCESCVGFYNRVRAEMGMEPFVVHPGAYEPQEWND